MLEKRRPAGDEVTAESLNESTDLDSLLSAILGDRGDDAFHKEPSRVSNVAPFRLAEVERPIMPDHGPADPEEQDRLAWLTEQPALLDDSDRPNVRTMERRSEEDSSQSIREGSLSHIYTRGKRRHGRSRTLLPLIGAVSVLILLGVFGLRQIITPVPAADSTDAGTTAVPAPAAVTVPRSSPPTVAGTPAIDASGLAATTAGQPPPKAPSRVYDSPRPAVVRPVAVASRPAPPPATSTEGSTAKPPTPASSLPVATTAALAPDAPTLQPAATRETAPDSATVRIDGPPPAAAGPAAEATTAVPAIRPTQPRLVTGGAPDYPRALRSAKIGGTVEVTLTIDAAGRVKSAQSLSGPPQLLRAAAEAAVMRWRYQPAMLNGVPVQTETNVRFVFDPQTQARKEEN